MAPSISCFSELLVWQLLSFISRTIRYQAAVLLWLGWQLALAQTAPSAVGQSTPTYRPQYHFTPPQHWTNDPNGLIYLNGEYHLFYQYNPFGDVWGHMSWGHAISKDLVHWESLPVAFAETAPAADSSQIMAFSGSAVIDKGNRSGLCPPGTKDCMVAIYTSHVHKNQNVQAQHQSLAYSSDQGRTWQQYDKNPVLALNTTEFRDPNVSWYAPAQKWIMAVVKPNQHTVLFYESKDLKSWKLMSMFGKAGDTSRVWECPALLEVPILNAPNQKRWVLFVSAGHVQEGYLGMQYFVGNFDGTTFTPDKENPKPRFPEFANVVDYGKDYYAAIQFNNLPDQQSKPMMIGWLNSWEYANRIPTVGYRGMMSLPREIALKRTADGLQLVQYPTAAVTSLRGQGIDLKNISLTSQSQKLDGISGQTLDIETTITPGTAQAVGLKILKGTKEETIIRYKNGKLELDRTHSGNVAFSNRFPSVETAPVNLQQGKLKLRILIDVSVVEVFVNDGERVITDLVFPLESNGNVELFSEGGTAIFDRIQVWPMK